MEIEKSVLAGAVTVFRMLADGSMSVTLVFAPADRIQAMTMMGEPGASIACVRLKDGHAAVPREGAKVGPRCMEANDLCRNPQFQQWVAIQLRGRGSKSDHVTEADCKALILRRCDIESRKDLDENDDAFELFKRNIRVPFQAYVRSLR